MILLENDPYISALAEVYDTSSTPILLTDGNLTPVYCNAACSQTYGGLCEPGVLKALVLPDGGCAEELLKDRHALRAEVRDMPFRALVLTRLYNDKGQTAAWRVMTEGDDKNGAALLRNENVRNTIRYELLKPCADILSTVRGLLKAGQDSAELQRVRRQAFCVLRSVGRIEQMVGAEVRFGERKLMDLQTVFSRFATQYSFEIFDLTDGRPLPVYGDCAVLYRALSLCAQELLTMPSNGKYDSKPHVRLTADETTVCLSLIRCRVRPDDDDTGVRMVDAAVTKAGGEVRTVCHTDGESRYGYEIKYPRTVLPEKDNCMTDEFDKYLKDNAFVHDYLSFLCEM